MRYFDSTAMGNGVCVCVYIYFYKETYFLLLSFKGWIIFLKHSIKRATTKIINKLSEYNIMISKSMRKYTPE